MIKKWVSIFGCLTAVLFIPASCMKETEGYEVYANGLNFDMHCNTDSSFYYYTLNSHKQFLMMNNRRVSVNFKNDVTREELNAIGEQHFEIDSIGFYRGTRLAHIYLKGGISCQGIESIIREVTRLENVVCCNPTFYLNDSTVYNNRPVDDRIDLITLTDEFVVKLKSDQPVSVMESLAEQTGSSILQSQNGIFLLSADKHARYNSLEMSRYFYETGKFEFSHPNFIQNQILHQLFVIN